jgi:multidrug efflux pump subunit AcrA (membrane-fusion protein)
MSGTTVVTKWRRWGGRVALLLAFAAGVILPMLWLAGKFAPKVPARPASTQFPSSEVRGEVAAVRLIRLPLYESAVGTIRAVHETTIGSKLLARVMEVNLKAGQKVHVGDVLVRLDDTDLKAKFQQARAALVSLEAIRAQAVLDEQRYARLLPQKAISQQEYERAATAVQTAGADLRRAEEAVNEVQATLDWATICSPLDGTIIQGDCTINHVPTRTCSRYCSFQPAERRLFLIPSLSVVSFLSIASAVRRRRLKFASA